MFWEKNALKKSVNLKHECEIFKGQYEGLCTKNWGALYYTKCLDTQDYTNLDYI
jgi:hypothetical protein